jgi:hypothetical protein
MNDDRLVHCFHCPSISHLFRLFCFYVQCNTSLSVRSIGRHLDIVFSFSLLSLLVLGHDDQDGDLIHTHTNTPTYTDTHRHGRIRSSFELFVDLNRRD